MPRVRIIGDPFDLATYEEVKTADVLALLRERFPTWPHTARLYRDVIAVENDVTPANEDDVSVISVAGEADLFYVVVYPGDPITAIITVVVTIALTVAVLLFLTPKIPSRSDQDQSSNNTLGARVNKPRANGRIEDIFGLVISIPTLLTVPLNFFADNVEHEVFYGCVGRGEYEISGVRDGDTPIEQIAGAGVRFYGPNTSPNSGAPFLEIGADIDQPLLSVSKVNDVNGQVLRAPNANQVSGDNDIRFVYPDTIERIGTIDFTKFFAPGDALTINSTSLVNDPGSTTITTSARFLDGGIIEFETINPSTLFAPGDPLTITNGGYAGDNDVGGILYVNMDDSYVISAVSATTVTLSSPELVNGDWDALSDYAADRTEYRDSTFTSPGVAIGYNLDGTYNIVAVSADSIVLTNPSLVNASWGNLDDLPDNATDYISPSLSTNGERWVGPFVIDMTDCSQIVANVVAAQGMYLVTKKGKNRPWSVTVEFEVTPVDEDGLAIGSPEAFNLAVNGDGIDKTPVGVTAWVNPTFSGRVSVRARRLTGIDLGSENTIVDEVKWRDCYGTAPVEALHFGDVTTLHSLTMATGGAASVKERKLNCRAVRKVAVRNEDDTFGPELAASRNAADIICHMALDPHIGARDLSELDVPQIYDAVAEIQEYFGIDDAAEFGYTFDQDNVSAEEMIQTVARAVFCIAYRQGSVLRMFFERETTDSILLFNHRNKIPRSEVRTVRFGHFNDYDGVEMDYISGVDGAKLTLYIPEDQSAAKPKKIELLGVTDRRGDAAVPSLHANRAWNKIRYQNTTTQFTALGEASQLVLNQRIEVTDNTRPDVFDGEVVDQDGLVLELSQPFDPVEDVDYTIFLQLSDGTVETRTCAAGPDRMHCTLLAPPSSPLVTRDDAWARTTFQITGSGDARPSAFLLSEKGPFEKHTVSVQAINYDAKYYQYDLNYKV